MARRQVKIDKSFFRKERDQAYDDFRMAWWREQFQNSVDAGAENIRIEMNLQSPRGAFDEHRTEAEEVLRIVFADDGVGMSREILENVYFRVGQSTKDATGSTIGGFGRARLMTCFAQDRYSILTGDSFVLGDGDQFDVWSLDEAVGELARLERSAQANDLSTEGYNQTVKDLYKDRYLVEAAKANGGYKGCRIEVDMETWRTSPNSYAPVASLSNMQRSLKKYLSESQIKANVTINGQPPEDYFAVDKKVETRIGRAKKILTYEVDGEAKEFAKLYVVKKEHETDSARAIVRVDGASMYADSILNLNGVDVVIEIAPKLSRMVLNANRDGMRSPFSDIVNKQKQELAIDSKTALAEKAGIKHYTVAGEHGTIRTERKTLTQIMENVRADNNTLARELPRARPAQRFDAAALREAGITFDAAKAFLQTVNSGNSFLNTVLYEVTVDPELDRAVREFRTKIHDYPRAADNPVDIIVECCPPSLQAWLVTELKNRLDRAKAEVAEVHEKRVANLNDTVIKVVSTNGQTKPVIRKFDPNNWEIGDGKGKRNHALLAGWTSAVAIAMETLLDVRPAMDPVTWRGGFVFSVAELQWQGDATRPTRIEAMKTKGEDGAHEILVNPVYDDGKNAYRMTNDSDVWRMISLAIHEVAHVLHEYHNEEFAGLQTEIIAKIDPVTAIRRVKNGVAAAMAVYGGKAIVHALDDEPGPRPADRLRALTQGRISEEEYQRTNRFTGGMHR